MMEREVGKAKQGRQRQIKSLALTGHSSMNCAVTQQISDGASAG